MRYAYEVQSMYERTADSGVESIHGFGLFARACLEMITCCDGPAMLAPTGAFAFELPVVLVELPREQPAINSNAAHAKPTDATRTMSRALVESGLRRSRWSSVVLTVLAIDGRGVARRVPVEHCGDGRTTYRTSCRLCGNTRGRALLPAPLGASDSQIRVCRVEPYFHAGYPAGTPSTLTGLCVPVPVLQALQLFCT